MHQPANVKYLDGDYLPISHTVKHNAIELRALLFGIQEIIYIVGLFSQFSFNLFNNCKKCS